MSASALRARHFLALSDAALLQTNSLLLVARAIDDCVDAHAMGVVHGVAGVGKTFSLEHHLAQRPEIETVWVDSVQRPTMRRLAQELMFGLTGAKPPGGRTDMLDELVALLSDKPRLVIIDEAQRLNHECIDFFRYLHDRRQTEFALILAGGNNCWEVLSREPMLRSRVWRRVHIRPMTEQAVLQHIPGYHSIYDGIDLELLLWINERFAHGVLRDWAAFTRTAGALCAEQERELDRATVRLAFALHGGQPDD